MKKSLALTIVSLALTLSAQAIRPIHKAFPVKQTDGTTVMLYRNGDGHLAFFTTEDNQVVVRNAQGTLCYAKLEGTNLVATDIVVHDIDSRSQAEQAFVKQNSLKPTDQALVKLVAPQPRLAGLKKIGGVSTADGLGKYGTSATGPVPTIGSPKIPVIMVEFADKKFQPEMTTDKLDRILNAEGYHEDNNYEVGSVKDYFKAQSRGMFTPDFQVVAKVELTKGYAYYGENNNGVHGGGDINAYAMVKEAVNSAISQGVDFDQFKTNGKVPNVIVYYAGCGEATGGDDNTIWPHELDLPISYGNMGGHQFGSYFVGNELYGTDTNHSMMGIGVLVHEFGHAMGLPDFYDPSYSYSGDSGFGDWSVMDNGAYVNNAYAPVGYNAYERSFMGWLDIKEITEPGLVTLASPNSTEGDIAVMFRNPSNTREYFIFENRQPGTWCPEAFGSGVLLTRVAYNSAAWTYNTVNTNQTQKRAMVVTADGSQISETSLHSQYHLYGNGVNNKATYRYINGTSESGYPMFNVMKQPDGTVVLSFKEKGAKPEAIVGDDVYQKVTDASILASGDVIVLANENSGVAISDAKKTLYTTVYAKVEGDKLYGNDLVQQFKLNKNGSQWLMRLVKSGNPYLAAGTNGPTTSNAINVNCFTTINIDNGNVAINFPRSKYDKNNICFDEDNYLFYSDTEAKGSYQIYRKVEVDAINGISADTPAIQDNRMFNLAGQQVGQDYKGIVIQNGKKYLKK